MAEEHLLGKGNRAQPHGEMEMSPAGGGKPVKRCLYPHPSLAETPALPEMERQRDTPAVPKEMEEKGGKTRGSNLGRVSPCPHQPALAPPSRQADFHPRTWLKTSAIGCPAVFRGKSP